MCFMVCFPEQKLPALYLMDSIMKNLGGEYLQLFSKNIVATFCLTFEKVVQSCKGSACNVLCLHLYRLSQRRE